MANLGEAWVELRAKMDKFERELKGAKMATINASQKMQKSLNQVSDAGKGIAPGLRAATKATGPLKAGLKSIAKVALPIVAIGTLVLKIKEASEVAREFNKAMANVRTMMDRTDEAFQAVKEQVIDMSIAMGKSAKELSEGLYQVVSQLGDTENNMFALQVATKAATAGVASVNDAINLGAAVVKGYNMEVADLTKVYDYAFQTVKLGATTFGELAQTMGKVIPIASSLNISQEELWGTMATLTGVTGNTAEVTTQLRSVLASLLQPSSEAKKVAEELGIQWDANAVKTMGLQGVLKQLIGRTDITEEHIGKLTGRIEATNAVMALTGSLAGQWAKKINAMGKAAGAADEAFKKQANTYDFVKKRFDALLASWKIASGNWFNENIVKPIMQGIIWISENWGILWRNSLKIMQLTFQQIGKIVWKFFTNRSTFEAGIKLLIEFSKSCLKIWVDTFGFIGKVIARSSSIIWAPLIKSLQWLSDNIIYYFKSGIEKARNAILSGINQITPFFVKMVNIFIDGINKMIGGAENFTNFFLSGMEKLKAGWDLLMKGIGWFAKHILRQELPDWMTAFEKDWEVSFGRIKKLSEESLTFKIPESTLKEPAKFTARMSEAWEEIKKQYRSIPEDLRKYVDNLKERWEDVVSAAQKFGTEINWEDFLEKIGKLVEKFKEGKTSVDDLNTSLQDLTKNLEELVGIAEEGTTQFRNLHSEFNKIEELMTKMGYGTSNWKELLEGIVEEGTRKSRGLNDEFNKIEALLTHLTATTEDWNKKLSATPWFKYLEFKKTLEGIKEEGTSTIKRIQSDFNEVEKQMGGAIDRYYDWRAATISLEETHKVRSRLVSEQINEVEALLTHLTATTEDWNKKISATPWFKYLEFKNTLEGIKEEGTSAFTKTTSTLEETEKLMTEAREREEELAQKMWEYGVVAGEVSELTSSALKRTQSDINRVEQQMTWFGKQNLSVYERWLEANKNVETKLADVMSAAIISGKGIQGAFQNAGQYIMNYFVKQVLDAVITKLLEALAIKKLLGGIFGGFFGAIFGFEKGAYLPKSSLVPIVPAQEGFYTKKPTLAAVAESGVPEIVSPEPKLREIVREEGGRGVNIENVNINLEFPNVRSAEDLINNASLLDETISRSLNRLKRSGRITGDITVRV